LSPSVFGTAVTSGSGEHPPIAVQASIRAAAKRNRERFEAQEKAGGLAMPPAPLTKLRKKNDVVDRAEAVASGNDTRVCFVGDTDPKTIKQALGKKIFGGGSTIPVSHLHEATVIVIPDEDLDSSTPTAAHLHARLHGQTLLTKRAVESDGKFGAKISFQGPTDTLAVFTTPAFRQKHIRTHKMLHDILKRSPPGTKLAATAVASAHMDIDAITRCCQERQFKNWVLWCTRKEVGSLVENAMLVDSTRVCTIGQFMRRGVAIV
jgi:hypothetical protein